MVYIKAPPPLVPPKPSFQVIPAGESLLRLYDPRNHSAAPLKFRHFGPLRRFDHHTDHSDPTDDPLRGIIYAGRTLSSCLVEIFGDSKTIVVGSWEVAILKLKRDLKFLDLRGSNAMTAGTVAAVCKDSNHRFSQEWSRFFYETIFVYGEIDGLIFGNAHNDEDAFAVYERAVDSFEPATTCPLRDEALRPEVLANSQQFNMHVQPY